MAVMAVGVTLVTVAGTPARLTVAPAWKPVPLTVMMRPPLTFAQMGETLEIVVRNAGAMLHEFVLGTKKELDEHAALMLRFPDMEHDEPYMAHVPPGKTGQIVWTFNRPGDFEFACLIAGHYQAGMVGKITVSAK